MKTLSSVNSVCPRTSKIPSLIPHFFILEPGHLLKPHPSKAFPDPSLQSHRKS